MPTALSCCGSLNTFVDLLCARPWNTSGNKPDEGPRRACILWGGAQRMINSEHSNE